MKTVKIPLSLRALRVDSNKYRSGYQTVGCVYNRYRLVHPWVPEMVLNVQSKFFLLGLSIIPTYWFESTVISQPLHVSV